MLKIRLKRIGKKHQPFYRIVVAEHTNFVKGKFLRKIGHYNPFTKEIVLDSQMALDWMNKGAKPSNTVAKLFVKQGLKHKSIVIKKFRAKSKEELKVEKESKETEKAKDTVKAEDQKVESTTDIEKKKAKTQPVSESDKITAKPLNIEKKEEKK